MQHSNTQTDRTRTQTAAVIGAATPLGSRTALLLALAGCHVLLSDHDQAGSAGTLEEILRIAPGADVELLPCERTSCWEADIIVIASGITSRSRILDRIRDVATGKIVLAVGSAAESGPALHARMPHARLVRMTGTKPVLGSDDAEARETIARLLDAGDRALRHRKAQAA
jgi:NAD(P)-dependent dehydrogenase (short-subunit alcohol dehydrogenase family)